MTAPVEIRALPGLPEFGEGTELGSEIAGRAELEPGDIVVISQKIVSKAEGRIVHLGEVVTTAEAVALAAEVENEPAMVQLILDESRRIVRSAPGVLITETHSGWVCANAGIDSSNVGGDGTVALLPRDPDDSARQIRAQIGRPQPGIVIADSFGRPWRMGQCDVAIGVAGLRPLDDWRGRGDRDGRELGATLIAVADQIAAAADLARDKASGHPVVVVRGLERHVTAEDGPGAVELQRAAGEDLFR